MPKLVGARQSRLGQTPVLLRNVAILTLQCQIALTVTAGAWCGTVWAEGAARAIPSRTLPMPDTVSPALQKVIGQAPHSEPGQKIPATAAEWKVFAASVSKDSSLLPESAKLRLQFGVTVAPRVIGGVPCYIVTPKVVKPGNRNRLLFGVHGGGFIGGAGESGLFEAIEMAGLTGIVAVAVDYRMPPDHPFPAAMDDAISVWKQAVKMAKPGNIAVFGNSAGGALALSIVQRARMEGLPLPGAVMAGSPWSDLSKTGDSYYTNAGVDHLLVTYDGLLGAAAKLYANGRDLKDPLLSPIYGDFTDFPPTFLVSGTRDLFLSNTVRVHQQLLRAGVPTQLEVEEGQSHTEYLFAATAGAPEGRELYSDVARFFDSHLGH